MKLIQRTVVTDRHNDGNIYKTYQITRVARQQCNRLVSYNLYWHLLLNNLCFFYKLHSSDL